MTGNLSLNGCRCEAINHAKSGGNMILPRVGRPISEAFFLILGGIYILKEKNLSYRPKKIYLTTER